MNKKSIIPIISMVSVLVMFVWGYLEGTYEHSWLAVFAGGIAITVLTLVNKDKWEDGDRKKDQEKDQGPNP